MFGCIEFEGKKINEKLYGKKVSKNNYNLFYCLGVLKIIKLLRNVLTSTFKILKIKRNFF